jgi:hypothetical protein
MEGIDVAAIPVAVEWPITHAPEPNPTGFGWRDTSYIELISCH